jgi:CheY-like chemotaxis protein
MLARALKEQDNLRRRAELSLEAARRAAELTGQLLSFARRQTLAPKAVEPNKLVTDLQELVRRTLGAQIDIELQLDEAPWRCKVDSTQLETAILNLALNARDAMPEGGTLTIATSHRSLAPGDAGVSVELPAGDYVVIDVTDTGTGMTPEVLARVFEPFFTTKDIGKGSGLGLAMVYGFVKQSGGHVAIESEPGRGTKVSLYLPRAVEPAASAAAPAFRDDTPLPGGGETILVVEDDPAVRELVTESLRRLGYRVLVAGNGSTARNILFGGEKVDLLFTDIMMPGGITGTQLAAEVEARLPGLRILFTTGYADAPALKARPGQPGVSLLRKPYKTRVLALTVRRALDQAA